MTAQGDFGPNQRGLNLTFDQRNLRVKEASFASWLKGKKQLIWWTAVVFELALAGWLWTEQLEVYNLLISLALSQILVIIWYRWQLTDLPSRSADGVEQRLDQLIAGECLPEAAKAKSSQELWVLIDSNWQVRFMINRFGLDGRAISGLLSNNPDSLNRVWQAAYSLAKNLGPAPITAAVLSVALILSLPNIEAYLAQLKLSPEDLLNGLLWQRRLEQMLSRARYRGVYGGVGRDWAFGYTPLLNKLAVNISQQVEAGSSHINLEAHDSLLQPIMTVLSQPVKNSVALVGETGVGKTTLAYSLAEEILDGHTESGLKYAQVFSLNASVLIANAKDRGQLEGLVLRLLSEAAHAKNVIIFLDDAQLFFSDETGSVNLSNVLLPILQNTNIRLLLAITPATWQKLLATNPEVAAQLNYQSVTEPDEATTLAVLQDQALLIEAQTKSLITYQAIAEAYRLAERYDQDQANPGKAIKLLLAAANYTQSGIVTIGSVQQSVESTLGVKVTEASQLEKGQLLNLEGQLHKRMINQDYAVKVVSDALRRARAGVKTSQRPTGSFLFLGPTGVGKTQLAKALAAVYFGGIDSIVRVDMSEFANAGDEQRLLADSGSGNAHSFLTQIRTRPTSVVLLDEVEKAHSQVLNLLLQMLDEGQLTDGSGRTVSFKEAIIIATSNAGADTIRAQIEAGQSLEQFSTQFTDSLIDSKQFLPELINRFDEVVLFRPLNNPELRQVVDLMMNEVNQELKRQKIKVILSDGAKDWLVSAGNDPRLGARPLRRTIQRTVENVVAKQLLSGQIQPGEQIVLNASDLESAAKR